MKASRILLAVLLVISGIALADDSDAPKDQPNGERDRCRSVVG